MTNLLLRIFIACPFFYLNASAQQPDLRGPIHSDQFTVNQTGEGIFVTQFTYKPFTDAGLNGHWIWIDPQRYPEQQNTRSVWIGQRKEKSAEVVKFKRIINLDSDVDFADIKLSADISYRLFINGMLTSRGPANTGSDYFDSVPPQHWFYDRFRSKRAFKKGINIIAVEVSTVSRIVSFTTTARAGFILEAAIALKSGRTINLKTDTDWVCEPSNSMMDFNKDASLESSDWYTDSIYDRSWGHAVILPDSISANWNLRQSELPQLMEKRIFPVKLLKTAANGDTIAVSFPLVLKASTVPQKIMLVFDNLYAGYIGLNVNGKSGARLNLLPQEIAGSQGRNFNYTLRDGDQTYEFPELTDGKYIEVTVVNPTADLTINEIVINFSSFPVSYTGSFNCSDPTLNAIWRNIRWITQLNMQTHHMDSPHAQEPLSDAGDYLIESLVNDYTFSSPLLVRQDLRKIALILRKTNNRMFHTSYMLLWLQMLVNYYEYTGDKALLGELAPDVHRLLAQFKMYTGREGIVSEAPNYMFMDWGEIDGIGFHHPPAGMGQGYMTAFYYKALTDGIKIDGYLDDRVNADILATLAEKLKTAFVNTLYDPKTGLFKNGMAGITDVKPYDWLPQDTSISVSLPYVNTLAVLYGLAPVDRGKDILQYVLTQKDVNMSPYFMYFVFEAMAKANAFNLYGPEQLRRWKDLSLHPVGLKEGWAMGDYSHAWGGSPAYELSSKVLGVYPAKPGFKAVTIYPHPGDLKFARGLVPAPNGNITVSWQRGDKDFFLKAATPSVMPVSFILPLYKTTDILVNGKPLMHNNKIYPLKNLKAFKRKGDEIVINATGGNYKIRVIEK